MEFFARETFAQETASVIAFAYIGAVAIAVAALLLALIDADNAQTPKFMDHPWFHP